MIRRGALYPTRPPSKLDLAGLGLASLLIVEIGVASALHVSGAPSTTQLVVQLAIAATFLALAIADLRLAVAVCVLELVIGGASGRWTILPADVSGRMMLDVIVVLVSVVLLARRAREGSVALGRYTTHAVLIALLIPAIWIPIGVISGNGLANAIGDGDGFLFFGFAIVLAAAALHGDLGWLRRWILVCAVVEAAITLLVAGLMMSGTVTHQSLVNVLIWTLDMGGRIDSLAAGMRIYLASGLFLQVGVAIAAWELLRNPRRAWPWIVLVVLGVATLVSMTRGYWLGAAICASMVLIFGRASTREQLAAGSRRPVKLALGFGLAAFIVVALVGAGGGMSSNLVKLYQAVILLIHILERPMMGFGLGAIAPDYQFGTSYTYEITYLDRAFKLGVLGLILFMSLPIRLLVDSWRVLAGRLAGAVATVPGEGVVPLAILASVLVVSATNPYLVGSVGIGAVLLTIAWLDPFKAPETEAS